ncbi:hypothetical protein APLC1_2843 [Limnospira platensis C1]|nr:hypothetical protein APLC1_2843 [Arthrospira platensis C1]
MDGASRLKAFLFILNYLNLTHLTSLKNAIFFSTPLQQIITICFRRLSFKQLFKYLIQ